MIDVDNPKVFGPLSVVRIRGFEPYSGDDECFPAGSAGYFVGSYGLQFEDHDPARPGILGYEGLGEGSRFDVLIAVGEVDSLTGEATRVRYVVERAEPLAMPRDFREDDGFRVVVRRRGSGWLVERH